jgi:hypothetical protein
MSYSDWRDATDDLNYKEMFAEAVIGGVTDYALEAAITLLTGEDFSDEDNALTQMESV